MYVLAGSMYMYACTYCTLHLCIYMYMYTCILMHFIMCVCNRWKPTIVKTNHTQQASAK